MRLRVLIFDDDELIRLLIRGICERHGYDVITYANPGVCPLNAEEHCPCSSEEVCADVIISDLEMPIVKGLDFVESMSRKGCHCRHIALVSGSCESEEVSRAVTLGCKVIPKPFKVKEIEGWLEEVEHSLAANRCLHDW
jgi:CheY-like chemotaxis protein